ncbi:MAG: transaldolase family protein [Candidatus Bipolaricaulota bacterium]
MKLILISADLKDIERSYALGVFSGVAGNPSLVADAGVPSPEMVRAILRIVPDRVFVQVSGIAADAMVAEGSELAAIDAQRVVVKVPVTAAGIQAIHRLSRQGVTVTATAICASNEALLATLAGARYLAPYMARISDIGGDGCRVVGEIVDLIRDRSLPAEVIAASVRTPEELSLAWRAGAHFAAVQSSVIWKICANPAVEAAAQSFSEDYAARFGSRAR